MTMSKIGLGALALSCAAFLHAEFENPVIDKYSDDVTFYNQFENEGVATLSTGENTPFRKAGKPEYAPGISGQALKTGCFLYYKGQDNADLSTYGTLIFWVGLEKTYVPVSKRKANDFAAYKDEPGFNAVAIHGNRYDYTLYSGKQLRESAMNSYVQYVSSKIEHVNCTVHECIVMKRWKPREWHMFAVTWRPGAFSASFDGGKMNHSMLKVPMTGNPEAIRLGFSETPMDVPLLMDEVVILNKELSGEQLKEIYDLSVKQFAADK